MRAGTSVLASHFLKVMVTVQLTGAGRGEPLPALRQSRAVAPVWAPETPDFAALDGGKGQPYPYHLNGYQKTLAKVGDLRKGGCMFGAVRTRLAPIPFK